MLSKKKYVCLIPMQTSCDCRHTPPHMHKISERLYNTHLTLYKCHSDVQCARPTLLC